MGQRKGKCLKEYWATCCKYQGILPFLKQWQQLHGRNSGQAGQRLEKVSGLPGTAETQHIPVVLTGQSSDKH